MYVNGSNWKLEAECVTYTQTYLSCNRRSLWLKKFIHVFNKYLLSVPYVPGTVLSTEDTSVDKTQISAVGVLHFSGAGTINNEPNKQSI